MPSINDILHSHRLNVTCRFDSCYPQMRTSHRLVSRAESSMPNCSRSTKRCWLKTPTPACTRGSFLNSTPQSLEQYPPSRTTWLLTTVIMIWRLSDSRGTHMQIPLLRTLLMLGPTMHPLFFCPSPHLSSQNTMSQFPSCPTSHTLSLDHLKYQTLSTALSPSPLSKSLWNLLQSRQPLQSRHWPTLVRQKRRAQSHLNQLWRLLIPTLTRLSLPPGAGGLWLLNRQILRSQSPPLAELWGIGLSLPSILHVGRTSLVLNQCCCSNTIFPVFSTPRRRK